MLAYPNKENGMFEIHVSICELEMCSLASVSEIVMCTCTYYFMELSLYL